MGPYGQKVTAITIPYPQGAAKTPEAAAFSVEAMRIPTVGPVNSGKRTVTGVTREDTQLRLHLDPDDVCAPTFYYADDGLS